MARSSDPIEPSFEIEHSLWRQGFERLAALDEVGRGCIAGCVAAAAVIFPVDLDPRLLEGVCDSKKLTPHQRNVLLSRICEHCIALGLGAASVAEIEALNIRRATALAMQRALKRIQVYDHILVDGLKMPELGTNQTAVVKGDQRSLSIAAASIVAKVHRDQWMAKLARQHPGYAWERNKGYGTPQHRRALQDLGITRHHRKAFIQNMI